MYCESSSKLYTEVHILVLRRGVSRVLLERDTSGGIVLSRRLSLIELMPTSVVAAAVVVRVAATRARLRVTTARVPSEVR